MNKFYCYGSFFLALSACGSSGAPAVTALGPFSVMSTAEVTAELDPNTDTITVDADPFTAQALNFTRNTSLDEGGFEAYELAGTESILFRGSTAGATMITVFSEPATTEPFNGTIFTRVGGTLPTSESATYQGSYIGFLRQGETGPSIGTVQGTIDASVSFSNGTFSGTISDRSYLKLAEDSADTDANILLADLILEEGAEIDEGAYSGPITSGAHADEQGLAAYITLVGGDNARDVAGLIVLDHEFDGSAARETGGFTGSR